MTEHRLPARLDRDDRREVLSTLSSLSSGAFGLDMEPYWSARSTSLFDQLSYLAVMHSPDGTPVGWTTCRRRRSTGPTLLYWDATAVLPEHQQHGLIQQVQGRVYRREFLTKGTAQLWVAYRTRSPVVLRGLRRALGHDNVHPAPGVELPVPVRHVAAEVVEWLADMPAVDPDTLVVHDAYAGLERLYAPELEPRSKDEQINAFMEQCLGPRDGLLVLARVRLSALAASLL